MKMNVNLLLKSVAVVIVLLAATALAQIWFEVFPEAIFLKVMISLVIVGAVASILIAITLDMDENKKMRDDKYLN